MFGFSRMAPARRPAVNGGPQPRRQRPGNGPAEARWSPNLPSPRPLNNKSHAGIEAPDRGMRGSDVEHPCLLLMSLGLTTPEGDQLGVGPLLRDRPPIE